MSEIHFGENLCEKEYTFKCKVIKKTTWYVDFDGKKQSTDHLVFLPQESTQQVLFYKAWLPSYPEQDYEVVAICTNPINDIARFSVNMANSFLDEPHLILMTIEEGNVRERLLRILEEKVKLNQDLTLTISVQPASSEESFKV